MYGTTNNDNPDESDDAPSGRNAVKHPDQEEHASNRPRSIRDAKNQTPAPRNDRTGAYLQTARTLAADHSPSGQEPAVGGIFQGRVKSMSNI